MADRRRIAAALQYLGAMRDRAAEFGSGVADTLANRARDFGGLAYEAFTSDPNIGRMNTAEFAQAAAARAPTPRLDAAGRGAMELGRAVLTQPVETGKAIVQGEVDRARQAMTSPRAAGEYAGEFVNPLRLAAALRRGPMQDLDVYHGTPHRFPSTEANPLGELDASKIGTGEGAQAYGHGIYLAESPDVAKGYQPRDAKTEEKLMRLYKQAEARRDYDSMDVLESAMLHKTASELQEMYPQHGKLVNQIGKITAQSKSSLYKVDLPDEMIDRMLDWDKPLSKDAPQAVKDAFNKLAQTYPDLKEKLFAAYREGKPGSHYYSLLNDYAKTGDLVKNQMFASDAMRQAGIPGIRYLDEGSRNTALRPHFDVVRKRDGTTVMQVIEGGEKRPDIAELTASGEFELRGPIDKRTRNFVVFPGEEKKVKILRRE